MIVKNKEWESYTMSKKNQALEFYSIEEEKISKELNSTLYHIVHKKTQAKIAAIINEDDNKVFCVSFRTPANDSTGVPHILEHSVLCGSKNFPAKDPFMELAKGSLNTFLNAMTYPDKTMYPVASCNDVDFHNLMHVYLDAVFYPNIYKEEKIFMQEGWHYELADLESPLTINGVVYNEMKGAFSNADEVFAREIINSLYPDNTYGIESGGDPEVIPNLSYQQFVDFHKTLYHPSNSYIYLYGQLDLWDKLLFIHEEYLKDFDYLEMDTKIAIQEAFSKDLYLEREYSILEGEEEKDNSYLSYNVVTKDILDVERCIAFDILNYSLCSSPGAPIKMALQEAGIGKDVYSEYGDYLLQPYFSIVAKGSAQHQKEEFVTVIQNTLADIVKNKCNEKSLRAAINYFEFKYREADYGRFPKGLMYCLQMFKSWLYEDKNIFRHLECNQIFESLREKIGTSYYEDLIQEEILRNTHKLVLTMNPKVGLTEAKVKELEEQLELKKQSFTQEELEAIIESNKRLEEYQEAPSTKEEVEAIPILNREDLKREALVFINEKEEVAGVDVLTHPTYTNDIAYIRFVFDTKDIREDLFPYITFLKSILGLLDTENYSYGDLVDEIYLETGGIETVTNIYTQASDFNQAKVSLEFKAKTMYSNIEHAVTLIQEMMYHTKFRNKKRLLEIISESKARMQAQLVSAGDAVASMRALSYFSRTSALSETMNGLENYRWLDTLEKDFDQRYPEVVEKLEELCIALFRKENLLVDITACNHGIEKVKEYLPEFVENLHTASYEKGQFEPKVEIKNEGFQTAGQVQFVCRAGNFYDKGLEYTGVLKVLRVIMSYEYLWTQIRVKGGAYGCKCAFGKSGDSYFVSYRDPNLEQSVEVYEKAAEAVRNFNADERTMTQYVIGAISSMDTPLNPSAFGLYGLSMYMTGQSYEEVQRERDEVLDCAVENIQDAAKYIEAFMADDIVCVVGNAEKIQAAKDMFHAVEQLL